MSIEAVRFVTRHVRAPQHLVRNDLGHWVQAKALLYAIADLSGPSGTGCTASQTTLGETLGLRRQKINEMTQILVEHGHIIKDVKSRRYVVAGVDDHDPLTCGNEWCLKESGTIFRRRRVAKPKTGRADGNLADAVAEASFLRDFHTRTRTG